jgi:hypothetical protein
MGIVIMLLLASLRFTNIGGKFNASPPVPLPRPPVDHDHADTDCKDRDDKAPGRDGAICPACRPGTHALEQARLRVAARAKAKGKDS